jgi:hypothetical protein
MSGTAIPPKACSTDKRRRWKRRCRSRCGHWRRKPPSVGAWRGVRRERLGAASPKVTSDRRWRRSNRRRSSARLLRACPLRSDPRRWQAATWAWLAPAALGPPSDHIGRGRAPAHRASAKALPSQHPRRVHRARRRAAAGIRRRLRSGLARNSEVLPLYRAAIAWSRSLVRHATHKCGPNEARRVELCARIRVCIAATCMQSWLPPSRVCASPLRISAGTRGIHGDTQEDTATLPRGEHGASRGSEASATGAAGRRKGGSPQCGARGKGGDACGKLPGAASRSG